ncbi:MAG: cold shock domain-containing protein [Bacteroidota bacterium]
MADSFSKKEREKKKQKKRREKAERKKQKKLEGKSEVEFMYVDEDGNFTSIKPDPARKSKIKAEDIEIGVPKKEDIEDDGVRTGTVKFFDIEKGYGFIAGTGTHQSYFVHANNLIDQIRDHDRVTFEAEMGPKGPIAVNVKLLR